MRKKNYQQQYILASKRKRVVPRWIETYITYCIYATLSLFFLPLFLFSHDGIFAGHDIQNHLALLELFTKQFSLGHIPIRWIDWFYPGYNQPLFTFYQPLFYYLFQIPHSLGLPNTFSLKLLVITLWIASGLFMYLFTKAHFGRLGGLLSGVLYLLAPYHILDIFVRAALPEFCALTFVPAVFWAIKKVSNTQSMLATCSLAFFFSLFLCAHSPTIILFFIPIFSYVIYEFIITKSLKTLLLISGGLLYGMLLASYFLFPAIAEQQYIQSTYLHVGYYDFHQHFVCFPQLFLPSWGYGASVPGCTDTLSFQLGLVHWGVLLCTILLLAVYWKKNSINTKLLISIFVINFFIALCMTLQFTQSIWESNTYFENIQYPWRFLAVCIFTSSFVGGFVLSTISSTIAKRGVYLGIILLILLSYGWYLHPVVWLTENQTHFDSPQWKRRKLFSPARIGIHAKKCNYSS